MELSYTSTTLGGQWVYYERLKETHPDLYGFAKRAVEKIETQNEVQRAADYLMGLAQSESAKEVALLRRVFGVDININTFDPNFYLEIMRAINYAMNTKAAVDRYLARIKAGEAQITIAAHIGSYIIKVLNEGFMESIVDEINGSMGRGRSFVKVADEILSRRLPEVVERAVEAAFNSADFVGGDDKSLAELAQYLSTPYGSQLVQQIARDWHVDELKETLITQLRAASRNKRKDAGMKAVRGSINRTKWADGGLTLEAIENYVINAIVSQSVPGVSMHATASGATGMKADNIIAFDIDPDIIEDAVENGDYGTREKNIATIERLRQCLAGIDDGFIVYSSAKNYSLGKNFRGFGAGEAMKLVDYPTIVTRSSVTVSTLIGAIANTIPGAVGADQKANLEKVVAADIGNFLFDDIETIGAQAGGATVLHLFMLNGIYVPFSYLCYEMANAINAGGEKGVVDVSIRTPDSIMFSPPNDTGYARWKAQRDTALNSINISVRFLANFQKFMSMF